MTKRFLGRLQVTASNGSPGLLFAMRTILEVTKLIAHSPPGNFNSEQLMPNFERPGVFRSSDDWWKSVNHITIRVSCCTVWGKVKLICDEDEHSGSRGSLKLFCVLEPFSTLWKSFFVACLLFFHFPSCEAHRAGIVFNSLELWILTKGSFSKRARHGRKENKTKSWKQKTNVDKFIFLAISCPFFVPVPMKCHALPRKSTCMAQTSFLRLELWFVSWKERGAKKGNLLLPSPDGPIHYLAHHKTTREPHSRDDEGDKLEVIQRRNFSLAFILHFVTMNF